jgi:glutamyl-tRNA synthetase
VRDNVTLPADARRWVCVVCDDELMPSAEAREVIAHAAGGLFAAAIEALPERADDFRAYARAVGEAAGVKGKALFMPLRAALTGEVHGPEMSQLFPLIGVERARARLARWLA